MNKENYGMIIIMNKNLGKLVYNKETPKFLPINYGRYYTQELEDAVDYREATFDEKCEYIKKDFSWGTVLNIYPISNYQIIEYKDEEGDIFFHPYIEFEDENCTFKTLDQALIGCVVFKNVGKNSSLQYYISKMLEC